LPISSRQRKADKAKVSVDLTKHIWAARKVTGVLRAKDGYGHISESEAAFFTIPDKIFVEPLAKAIIENRQLMIEAVQTEYQERPVLTRKDVKNQPIFDQYQPRYRLDRAAPQAQRAVDLLGIITDQPAGYYEDPALFMGLNFIRSQIRYADKVEDIAHIPDELWKVALRAEFGTLGTALEEMREAERALREAISRRAPQREIDLLFDRYNGAVETYLEELRRKALENPPEDQGGGGGSGPDTNQDEIEALLKAIEEANRIGDVDGARRALAKLAELLENLEIQLTPGGGGGGDGPPQDGELSEEEQEALEDLAELLGEQRELQSETERSEREAQNGQSEGGDQEQGQEESGQDGGQEQQGGDQAGQQQGGQQQGGQQQGGQQQGGQSIEDLRGRQQNLSERLAELQEQLDGLLDERQQQEGNAGGETEDGAAGETQDDGAQGGGDEADENNAARGGQGDDEAENGRGGGGEDETEQSLEESIGGALEAMRRSDDALGDAELRESIAQMAEAIRALRQAGDQLAEQASNQSEGQGEGEGQSAENGDEEDPFGRREDGIDGGLSTDTQVDLEDKNRQKRARELLEELRERAAEEEREQLEKDYLERLLKQF